MQDLTEFAKKHSGYIRTAWYQATNPDEIAEKFKGIYKGKPILFSMSNELAGIDKLNSIKVIQEGEDMEQAVA